MPPFMHHSDPVAVCTPKQAENRLIFWVVCSMLARSAVSAPSSSPIKRVEGRRQADEFMAGHAARWQGTGEGDVTPRQKSENPDNLPKFGDVKKTNGAHYNTA